MLVNDTDSFDNDGYRVFTQSGPAAGIALAAVLISGSRIMPGIFIGGILIQTTSFLDPSSTEKILTSLLIGTVISAAAVIQAWAGANLVHRFILNDEALVKERSIMSFCLLTGPISCVVSASISITTLWFAGILTANDIPLAWTTWWIGDSVGILAFSPVILCLFGKPRSLWKQRIVSVALPLCILSTIVFIIFKFSYQSEMRSLEDVFERNALQFTNELKNHIEVHLDTAKNLKEFFDSSNNVTAEQFTQYVKPKLTRHPEIKALEWIPMLLHKDRRNFENNLGAQIKFKNPQGRMETSPEKYLYFPIQYVEPYKGNENALGFDVRNTSLALKATETACSTGTVTATEAIKLIQETQEKLGIVFYAPVYKNDNLEIQTKNCESLSGFAASVLRLDDVINNIHKRLPDLKLSVSLTNNSQVFYNNVPENHKSLSIPNQFEFHIKHKLSIANQEWELSFYPATEFITFYSSWAIWSVIVIGFLISGLFGMALLMLTGRTLQTENTVKIRTTELQIEISERKHVASILALENKYLEMIAQDYSIHDILDSITSGIESFVPNTFASILLLDSDSKRLIHGSAPSLPKEYIEAIDGEEIGPAVGSCGTAAFLNKQIIVSNIETDPLWTDYRELALKHGLKACWSTPITVANDKVLGAFALYFKTPKEPDSRLIDLTQRMANITAITILRKQSEAQLTFNASHDALTGLVNRREFERRTERLLSTVKQDKDEHALCFMDLDQFKVINDTSGHVAGDEMLRQVSSALQSVVRKRDTLARLGGDEFGVLMEHCALDDAHRVATSLQKAIQDYQFVWEEHVFKVGVSIGLVPITESTNSLSLLLRDADAACYVAKDKGRNRIHVYQPDDLETNLRHGEMQWVTRLSQALEENRFCLYAQVIEPLDGSSDLHYELLLRMIDNKGETIPPGAFLPAAERYNLITKVDFWVIEHAFGLLKENPAFLEKINFCSINLSGQSLTEPDMLEFIIEKLDNSKIDGTKVCFEITETAAISNLSTAMTFISTLIGQGCRFALDDFGSGLSSFAYLKNLPVDYLKIDGMFVKDIVDDPIDHAMVKSINEIGHVMGMKTIAEFVENDVIKGMLKEIGVNYVQGYGIGKPRPFKEIIKTFS
jgi:diguanylate cyclase (GGDEF)-like protein